MTAALSPPAAVTAAGVSSRNNRRYSRRPFVEKHQQGPHSRQTGRRRFRQRVECGSLSFARFLERPAVAEFPEIIDMRRGGLRRLNDGEDQIRRLVAGMAATSEAVAPAVRAPRDGTAARERRRRLQRRWRRHPWRGSRRRLVRRRSGPDPGGRRPVRQRRGHNHRACVRGAFARRA